MTRSRLRLLVGVALIGLTAQALADEPAAVKEVVVAGPHDIAIKVRMEGPYTAEAPLQVVCYFKYTEEGAKRMKGAVVELDRHLHGVVKSLRTRSEFMGDELETLLITPGDGTIKAKALLLIGLGDESQLSLHTMERVGRTALREAKRLGVSKIAFAPLLRDQGNDALAVGPVETAVVRGMLLAYDTEQRLQAEALTNEYVLSEWWVEAGPAYFEETVGGVKEAVAQATAAIAARPSTRYALAEE